VNEHEIISEVSDNGCGIAVENQERIFDPFFSTFENGYGLGLAVVSRILEQHHAKVVVTSKPEEGTTFRISFPIPGRI
jgi:signal transduction histidine kinase